jgi:hypothetical protein
MFPGYDSYKIKEGIYIFFYKEEIERKKRAGKRHGIRYSKLLRNLNKFFIKI